VLRLDELKRPEAAVSSDEPQMELVSEF